MITMKYYDQDFVNPLPHVFDGIAVMTPPKNASSLIQLWYGQEGGRLTIAESEYDKSIAIKRDPIDRWCGAMNQQRSRLSRLFSKFEKLTDKDWAFWCQNPNDVVKLHAPKDSLIRNISEFCSQFDWAGSTKEYDEVYYLHQVDDVISDVLKLPTWKGHPHGEVYRHDSRKKGIELVSVNDLTDESKKIIMEQIYQDDYKYGWV
jgi:hypothetical protein